jgi:DNA polymerase III delta subunit
MAKAPDPRQELRRLEQAVQAGLAPGYVLRYDERWFAEQALECVKKAASAAQLELCSHDGDDPGFELSPLLDDLCGTAMFASARCVVWRSPEEHLKKSGAHEAPATRAIRSFLEGRRGTLVLLASGLRADHAAVKAVLAAGGLSLSFRALYDTPFSSRDDPTRVELVQWLRDRARERGLRLEPEPALMIAKAKGNDLFALDGEIERLASGGAGAGRELSGDAAGSPQRLADHLLVGDVPKALFEIETLWRGGFDKGKAGARETSAGAILAVLGGNLRRGIRQGLVASAALAAGASPDAAASAAGVPTWPKARQLFLTQLQARSAADWPRMQRELLALERRSRQGAEVDASDLAALALRWRLTPRAPARQGARR